MKTNKLSREIHQTIGTRDPGGRLGIWLLVWAVWTGWLSVPAQAQMYSIDWFTVDGGGGTSTGGVYAVSGTIGQPDAGAVMTGGPYSLSGGFWALYAVQTPGGPLLRIFRTPTNTVVVSWPSPSTGWNLQQNTNLTTTNWVAPLEAVQDDGTNRFIVVNPPTGSRFYRLTLTP
jgi:hypothetical protein